MKKAMEKQKISGNPYCSSKSSHESTVFIDLLAIPTMHGVGKKDAHRNLYNIFEALKTGTKTLRRCVQNHVKPCKMKLFLKIASGFQLSAVHYFCKKLHRRCLIGF